MFFHITYLFQNLSFIFTFYICCIRLHTFQNNVYLLGRKICSILLCNEIYSTYIYLPCCFILHIFDIYLLLLKTNYWCNFKYKTNTARNVSLSDSPVDTNVEYKIDHIPKNKNRKNLKIYFPYVSEHCPSFERKTIFFKVF